MIKLEGMTQLIAKTKNLRVRTDDPSMMYRVISSRIWKEQMRHFDMESGPDGKWEPLSDSTLARKRAGRGSGSPKILQDTGRMKNSIMPSSDKNGAYVSTGSNVKYAPYHQEGTKNIPQREYMWLSDEFIDDMSKIYLDGLIKSWTTA
jgi:phage virion morphogenesis protein